jgi:hypothetical protein
MEKLSIKYRAEDEQEKDEGKEESSGRTAYINPWDIYIIPIQ